MTCSLGLNIIRELGSWERLEDRARAKTPIAYVTGSETASTSHCNAIAPNTVLELGAEGPGRGEYQMGWGGWVEHTEEERNKTKMS